MHPQLKLDRPRSVPFLIRFSRISQPSWIGYPQPNQNYPGSVFRLVSLHICVYVYKMIFCSQSAILLGSCECWTLVGHLWLWPASTIFVLFLLCGLPLHCTQIQKRLFPFHFLSIWVSSNICTYMYIHVHLKYLKIGASECKHYMTLNFPIFHMLELISLSQQVKG